LVDAVFSLEEARRLAGLGLRRLVLAGSSRVRAGARLRLHQPRRGFGVPLGVELASVFSSLDPSSVCVTYDGLGPLADCARSVSLRVLSLPGWYAPLPPGKGVCGLCHCVVRLSGHAVRCDADGPRPSSGGAVDGLRRAAWLGDALHMFDVRYAILRLGCGDRELAVEAEGYVSASAQAEYLRRYAGSPSGASVAQQATVFESQYAGAFRQAYLSRVFPMVDFSGLVGFFGSGSGELSPRSGAAAGLGALGALLSEGGGLPGFFVW